MSTKNIDFTIVQKQVLAQYASMKDQILFRVSLPKEIIKETYLSAYPEEDRQEYNCNCCKQFLYHYGTMVYIDDKYELKTLWDFESEEPYFANMVSAMRDLIKSAKIDSVVYESSGKKGSEKTYVTSDKHNVSYFNHFFIDYKQKSLPIKSEDFRPYRDVLKRSLEELSLTSVQTVLDLIDNNSLYRGKEYETSLKALKILMNKYKKVSANKKEFFLWKHCYDSNKIRNTAIGTLLIDLSEGVDLEVAVTKFEKIVAPQNYKRPTSLVTQKMIDDAVKTIKELGLEDSLKRRYAISTDISLDNLLYVKRSTKSVSTNVLDNLTGVEKIDPKKQFKKIKLSELTHEILPNASNLELLVENRYVNNFMTLLTSEDANAPNIFKWSNNFTWDYNGNVTDSIKERVKKAGGAVDGDLRISLSWYNGDDLDLSVREPNGSLIYFGNKHSSLTKGFLDVDMNAGSPSTRNPVENICYKQLRNLVPGKYEIVVHNYRKRENIDTGFEIEIEILGEIKRFFYNKPVKDSERIIIATFNVSNKKEVTFSNTNLTNEVASKNVWSIDTQKFYDVSMVMSSPNFWTDSIGNHHTFFIIKELINDAKPRGLYNEFLSNELLEKHKRVFDLLGSKIVIEDSDEQLSGVGFSETKKDTFIVRVTVDNKKQIYTVEI